MATFQLFRDTRGDFRYRLRADNGETILASEAYTTKASALNGVESVRRNARYDGSYRRHQAATGYYFTLVAGNGEVIGVSEVYSTTYSRDKGIESVKYNAPTAQLQELP